jgi:hypothetical protein
MPKLASKERAELLRGPSSCVSKNFGIDGARSNDKIVEQLRIPELLEDPAQWTRPLGLYLMKGASHTFVRRENCELAPILTRGTNEIIGILSLSKLSNWLGNTRRRQWRRWSRSRRLESQTVPELRLQLQFSIALMAGHDRPFRRRASQTSNILFLTSL